MIASQTGDITLYMVFKKVTLRVYCYYMLLISILPYR